MIKAVFFDLYNTVVRYEPPREELHAKACHELGIEVAPEALRRTMPAADEYFYRENARSPVAKRPKEEKLAVYAEYEEMILKGAGVPVPRDLAVRVMNRMQQFDMKFVLFDDVVPALSQLKSRGLVLGLLSNIYLDLKPIFAELGVAPYFDFLLTSQEAGSEKPDPGIFLEALKRARVAASEAIHVGDQYYSDVTGARGVGIKPLLLDRDGYWEKVSDCIRISSLSEVVDYL